VKSLKKRAPDALISAFPVIAEGIPKQGFLEVILGRRPEMRATATKPHLESESIRGSSHLQTLRKPKHSWRWGSR